MDSNQLAGILAPNDEKCHLTEVPRGTESRYLYSLEKQLDYPSISQISRQISANSINMIFVVPPSVSAVYKALQSRLIGASLGELSNDSSNIVHIIKEQYDVSVAKLFKNRDITLTKFVSLTKKISSEVKLAYKSTEGVEVTFSSACQKEGNPIKTNDCKGIKPGTEVEFDVTITVNYLW